MRNKRQWWACFVILAGGCVTSTKGPAASTAERTPSGGVPYHGLIQYRAKDAKPAIMEPTFVVAAEALLAAGTKVTGVYIGGEARAYPLFILSNHQIVNDLVGGIPISASW